MPQSQTTEMAYPNDVDEATGLFDAIRTQQKGSELHEFYLAPIHSLMSSLTTSSQNRCWSAASTLFLPQARRNTASTAAKNGVNRVIRLTTSAERFATVVPLAKLSILLQFIENVTGIKGLIPDPPCHGSGVHEIAQGGHLSVHADFNHHVRLHLQRRANVLIDLIKDWKAGYGGQWEPWDNNMAPCVNSYVPCFSRCVIFSTTSHINHGNPMPVQHPEHQPRRSIALYS
jgi:hypothetical protein